MSALEGALTVSLHGLCCLDLCVVLGILLRGGKPVFPPSPGVDAEFFQWDGRGFLTTCTSTGSGGRAGAVQAWAGQPGAALVCVFILFPCVVVVCAGCSVNLPVTSPEALAYFCVFGLRHLVCWRAGSGWDHEVFGECRFVTSLMFSCVVLEVYLLAGFWKSQACFFTGKSVGKEDNYMMIKLSMWPQRAIFFSGLWAGDCPGQRVNKVLLGVLWMQLVHEVEGSKRKRALKVFSLNPTCISTPSPQ